MTKQNQSRYGGKHKEGIKLNPDIAEMIKNRAVDGKLPCAVAFKIAGEMDVKPVDVGITLDLLEIKISKCQMGIFGYAEGGKFFKSMKDVPPPLEKSIREMLKEGKLSCRDAWQVAEQLNTGRMDVASACDTLGIKISPCQLGAF